MNDIEKSETEKAPKKAEKSRVDFWAKMLSIAAFPISAVAGYFPLKIFSRAGIYKTYAQKGFFKNLQAERKGKCDQLCTEVLSAVEQAAVTAESEALAHTVPLKTSEIDKWYRDEVSHRFRRMGITNIRHYWKGMHPNQKFEVAFHGATAFGISLGVILTVANNLDKLKGLFDRDKSDDSSPSR